MICLLDYEIIYLHSIRRQEEGLITMANPEKSMLIVETGTKDNHKKS